MRMVRYIDVVDGKVELRRSTVYVNVHFYVAAARGRLGTPSINPSRTSISRIYLAFAAWDSGSAVHSR